MYVHIYKSRKTFQEHISSHILALKNENKNMKLYCILLQKMKLTLGEKKANVSQ